MGSDSTWMKGQIMEQINIKGDENGPTIKMLFKKFIIGRN